MYLENEKVDEIDDKLSQRDDGWGWEEEGGGGRGADNRKLKSICNQLLQNDNQYHQMN